MSLPGIQSLHDFLCVSKSPSGVMMKVHDKCYAGALKDTPMKVKRQFVVSQSCFPMVSDIYQSKGLIHLLTYKKMEIYKQMYQKFIPVDCWPSFLKSD